MYVKVIGDTIVKFPYHIADLHAENPNTSFPATISDASMLQWNAHKIHILPRPKFDERTQRIEEQTWPRFEDGQWVLGWDIVEKTEEEVTAYDNHIIEFVKNERTRRLTATDWMALSDNIITLEWKEYRQALRDITKQRGYPHTIEWPTPPKGE